MDTFHSEWTRSTQNGHVPLRMDSLQSEWFKKIEFIQECCSPNSYEREQQELKKIKETEEQGKHTSVIMEANETGRKKEVSMT